MKLNKKGFTMIELLAAVTILGVIATMAVVSYTKYQEKVRNDAYKAMEKSAFSAAQTYIADKGIVVPLTKTNAKPIEISTLVDEGYLKKLEDPRAKGSACHLGSTVKVYKTKHDGTKLEEHTYIVTIRCTGYVSSHINADGDVEEGVEFKS